jgi:tRNA threonylcarbamoyladenosine biosynthesis protein TsaB
MIVLALETTTDRLSVAGRRRLGSAVGRLGGWAEVERTYDGARMHAARLFPLIDEVLGELGVTLGEVNALALADGPGSFTGLRVGAAAAKALVRSCPRLGLWTASTLLVRAAAAMPPRRARVLVVTSALRGELYAASYRLDLPDTVETTMAPVVATPESLYRESPDLLVADAPDKLVDRLSDRLAVPLVRGGPARPAALGLAGLVGVTGGAERIENIDAWEPQYGRPAEAQARWEIAHGRTLPDSIGPAR